LAGFPQPSTSPSSLVGSEKRRKTTNSARAELKKRVR
jgi:hypothetical protein